MPLDADKTGKSLAGILGGILTLLFCVLTGTVLKKRTNSHRCRVNS
jgi:hypothetical protein